MSQSVAQVAVMGALIGGIIILSRLPVVPPIVQYGEVRCSSELAKRLGAVFGCYGGPGVLHWSDGYLWWIYR